MLSRAMDKGFLCHPAMLLDPWLDSLRARSEFTSLMSKAHQQHRDASTAFVAGGGASLLWVHSEGYLGGVTYGGRSPLIPTEGPIRVDAGGVSFVAYVPPTSH